MDVISKVAAKEAGLNRYFTGKPCKRGHVVERYVSGNQCVQCKSDLVKASRRSRTASTTAWRRKNPERWIWQTTKDRSKKRGIEFDLLPEDIVIPDVCPVLGIPLTSQTGGKSSPNSASIDRIDNSIGYLRNNIVIVSWRANRIKSDATLEELRSILKFYEAIR